MIPKAVVFKCKYHNDSIDHNWAYLIAYVGYNQEHTETIYMYNGHFVTSAQIWPRSYKTFIKTKIPTNEEVPYFKSLRC